MERIAFGAGLMKQSGVYLSTVYDGSTQKVTLTDEFGEVHVYLLQVHMAFFQNWNPKVSW